jgi:hypothetical protein
MTVQVALGNCAAIPTNPSYPAVTSPNGSVTVTGSGTANVTVEIDATGPIKGAGSVSDPFTLTTGAWAGPGTVDTCGQLLSLDASGNLRQREEKGSVFAPGVGSTPVTVNPNFTAPATIAAAGTGTASVTNPYCGQMTSRPAFRDKLSGYGTSTVFPAEIGMTYQHTVNGGAPVGHERNRGTWASTGSQFTLRDWRELWLYTIAGGATLTIATSTLAVEAINGSMNGQMTVQSEVYLSAHSN